MIKNGNIFVENESAHDLATLITHAHTEPISLHSMGQSGLRKANSDTILNDEQEQHSSTMNKSIISLSKSLGAKTLFADEESPIRNDQTLDSADSDVFVDAKDSRSALGTSTRSFNEQSTTEQPINNSNNCDKMYIVSGVSIKYEHMPSVSKYTR